MGLKGKPATSSSASGSAQQWAQPYATQGAQDVLDVFNQQQPNLAALQGNLNGQMASLGAMSGQMGKQADAYGKTAGQGNGFLGDVIGGDYMSGNPYIQNIMGQLDQSIMNGVNSGFEGAGRYGSGAYVGEMGKQLGNANTQLLYGNYSDEMNRRLAASQQAQSALSDQQKAQLAATQQQLAATQLASQVPYQGINSLGNSLGALFNGGTSTSTGAKPGILDYLMQGASNAASLGWQPLGK